MPILALDLATLDYIEQPKVKLASIGAARTKDTTAEQIAQAEARSASGEAGPFVLKVGNLEPVRDLGDVRDVAEAYLDILARGVVGEAYNVCTGRQTSIRQLADMLCSLCGKAVQITRAPARRGDIRTSVGNPEQAIRHLGLRAGTALADGLAQMLAQHPAGHAFARPAPVNG